MKRLIPSAVCFIFLAVVITLFVTAQPPNQDDDQPTTSPTTSTTAPTTPPDEFEFSFEYISEHKIKVSWKPADSEEIPEGLFVKVVKIGTTGELVNDTTGEFEVDISSIRPGLYTAVFTISDAEGNEKNYVAAEKVARVGEIYTSISLEESNNQLIAYVYRKDDVFSPLSDIKVVYYIGNIPFEEKHTDENGYARFDNLLPQDKNDVYCVIEDNEIWIDYTLGISIKYIGTKVWLIEREETTTPPPSTTTTAKTTTTRPRRTTTTLKRTTTTTAPKATLPIIWGAGTTAVVGDKVAINVSYDTGILSAFDYSSKDFADRSRMLIDSKLYGSIVYKNSVLYLLVQSSDIEITDQHISAAISGKSKYSLFHPEETLRIPMNLTLLVDNKSLNASSPVTLSDNEVEVELPAPKSAKGSNYTFVAAEFDENGITGFLDTFVEDGILKFKTKNLSSIVLLGFKNPKGLGSGINIPAPAIIMIAVGLLLLAGAFTLLYFFFLRKPKKLPALETGVGTAEPHAAEDGVPLGQLLDQPDAQDEGEEE